MREPAGSRLCAELKVVRLHDGACSRGGAPHACGQRRRASSGELALREDPASWALRLFEQWERTLFSAAGKVDVIRGKAVLEDRGEEPGDRTLGHGCPPK